jgi:alpha-L-fucosidase
MPTTNAEAPGAVWEKGSSKENAAMKTSWTLVVGVALATAAPAAAEPPGGAPGKAAEGALKLPVAPGPFQPTWDSLGQYRCPDWFRDAKLGIWAHWGPQSVPMDGDWYARNLYIQGQGQYKDHLEHYGHPTKQGYKDIIPLWKAEKWDPDRLMALYKKAGARYFVSMGVHHDNFDLWRSKHHRWNAVAMGPKRDVVGDWQKAARKQGLRFGVSEHLGASFTWFQPSHGSDKTGPLAGVPYDGADPKFQDLYHPPAAADDKGWYSKDPRWHQEWYDRIKDLVDQYQPDLLYSDGPVPFGNEVGRSLIAHLYNADTGRHGGKTEVVYTCKQHSTGAWVEDLERGVMPGVRPHPWQTDTSIGDWFYNRHWKYRSADWVIHMLVDIVSKNGNLLINVVQRPDGSLDPEAEHVLERMAAWIAVNGEAIYDTRPWLVHGEGPVRARGGNFREDFAYTARDIRFTTRGDRTLYALALGWPEDRKLVIRSLARLPGVTGKITGVSLLGHAGELRWLHDGDGLAVQLPAEKPCDDAIALKITGEDLRGFKPEAAGSDGAPAPRK